MTGVAFVPCFEIAQEQTYINACIDLNPSGATNQSKTTAPSYFECYSIVPYQYWEALQAAGLGTCMCGFRLEGNVTTVTGVYGDCNNACLATFTCNGNTPETESGGSGGSGSGSGGGGGGGGDEGGRSTTGAGSSLHAPPPTSWKIYGLSMAFLLLGVVHSSCI